MRLSKRFCACALALTLAVASFTACGGEEEKEEFKKPSTEATDNKNDSDDSNKNDAEKDDNKDDNKEENKDDNSSSDAQGMKELKDIMVEADDSLPAMSVVYGSDENAEDLFPYLAEDFDYSKVDDYFYAYAAAGTADDVAVIKLKSADDAKDCVKNVEKHVEKRLIQFKTYDPSQVERCEKAVVFYNENYVVLIISDNSDKVKEAFYNAFN